MKYVLKHILQFNFFLKNFQKASKMPQNDKNVILPDLFYAF